jgi:large subunit ribosomal protein L30
MSTGTITVKLKRSTISCTKKQVATIAGLGLRKIGSVRTLENTPCTRGMVKKMIQWLDIVSEK